MEFSNTLSVYSIALQLLKEVLCFIVTEILIRLLFSKNLTHGVQSKVRKVYLLTTQGSLLLFISVIMWLYDHVPYILLLVTVFILLKLFVLLLTQSRGGDENTFVSSPLPFGSNRVNSETEKFDLNKVGYQGMEKKDYQRGPLRSHTSTAVNRNVMSGNTNQKVQVTTNTVNHPQSFNPSQHYQRPPVSFPKQRSLTSRISQSLFREHPKLGYFSSVLDFRKPNKSPPGLLNSGNTCFINSTLQCLIWMSGFIEALPVVNSVYNNETTFVKNLNEVIYQCNVLPDGVSVFDPVDATPFLKSISVVAPHLVAGFGRRQSQQDAAEFLLWFLDHLHTTLRDLSGGRSGLESVFTEANIATLLKAKQTCLMKLDKLRSVDTTSLQEPLTNLSEVDWQLNWQKRSSTLYKLFLGQLIEARECQQCQRMSVNVEYFTLLPLPLPSSSETDNVSLFSLEDCLTQFGSLEDLVQSNMISCSCISADESILTPGKRLAMLSYLPPRLVIQLTRYSYSSTMNTAVKNNVHINLPMQLDLSSYTMKSKLSPGASTNPLPYELRAVCLHSGSQSTSFGHYVAYCKVANDDWYHFNDDIVSPVLSIEAELTTRFVLENAYLLFYQNVNAIH